MAILTPSSAPDMGSDASFRLWAKSISDTILAGGWVAGTDTGQINFATATKPAGAGASAGYSIFRMNDSLQATAPCYIKMEYGTGTASNGYPGIWITVGTGTDGAGNITGAIGLRGHMYMTSSTATLYTSRYSIDTNRFSIAFWTGWSTIFMCVERMHDNTGADTPLGIIYAITSPNGAYSGAVYIGGPSTSYMSNWNVVLPATMASMAFGTTVYLMPVRTMGFGETSPFLGVSVYYNVDLTAYNPIPIKNWDGTTRYVLPLYVPSGIVSYGSSGAIAMRYD